MAFASRALAERYLTLMAVQRQCCVLGEDELTAQVSFDLASHGVLVFESDPDLDQFIVDSDGFDYASRMRHPDLGIVSEQPW